MNMAALDFLLFLKLKMPLKGTQFKSQENTPWNVTYFQKGLCTMFQAIVEKSACSPKQSTKVV